MASRPGNTVITGKTEVVEAGKAVKLTNGPVSSFGEITLGVLVQCDPSNVGTQCTIGDKNTLAEKTLGKTQGTVLEKKQLPVRIEVSDPTQLYVDAEKSKDFVTWTVIVG